MFFESVNVLFEYAVTNGGIPDKVQLADSYKDIRDFRFVNPTDFLRFVAGKRGVQLCRRVNVVAYKTARHSGTETFLYFRANSDASRNVANSLTKCSMRFGARSTTLNFIFDALRSFL